MLIRVRFGDNDFCKPIYKTCECVLFEIANGYTGQALLEMFNKYIDTYGLENLRQRIVLGSMGYYICMKGVMGRFENNFVDGVTSGKYNDELNVFNSTFIYLDESIKVELVSDYFESDDNYETCYIDVSNFKVVML